MAQTVTISIMISVLIATKNRSSVIKGCLTSILNSTVHDFEILLADQSTNNKTSNIIKELDSDKINYFKTAQLGKATALNLMIEKSRGKILAFTDDDCLVDKNWLRSIKNFYSVYPEADGVFGNTYPYKPEDHFLRYCPATFISDNVQIFKDINDLDYKKLGQGNNMSFKKNVFEKVGNFKEWLGPGRMWQSGGEDAELIFRLLVNKATVMTNPEMVVYHNKWLTRKEDNILQARYTTGVIAFLIYYLFTNKRSHAIKFILIHIWDKTIPMFQQISNLFKEMCKAAIFFLWEVLGVIKGICIGIVNALKEKLY